MTPWRLKATWSLVQKRFQASNKRSTKGPYYQPFVRGIHRWRWIPHTKASAADIVSINHDATRHGKEGKYWNSHMWLPERVCVENNEEWVQVLIEPTPGISECCYSSANGAPVHWLPSDALAMHLNDAGSSRSMQYTILTWSVIFRLNLFQFMISRDGKNDDESTTWQLRTHF